MACRIFKQPVRRLVFFQPVHRKTHRGYQGRARSRQPAIGDRLFRLPP